MQVYAAEVTEYITSKYVSTSGQNKDQNNAKTILIRSLRSICTEGYNGLRYLTIVKNTVNVLETLISLKPETRMFFF